MVREIQETEEVTLGGCLPELSPSRASAEASGTRARTRATSRGKNRGAMLQAEGGHEEERQC